MLKSKLGRPSYVDVTAQVVPGRRTTSTSAGRPAAVECVPDTIPHHEFQPITSTDESGNDEAEDVPESNSIDPPQSVRAVPPPSYDSLVGETSHSHFQTLAGKDDLNYV